MTKFVKALCLTAVLTTTNVLAYKANSVNVKDYPKGNILITAEEAIKLIGKEGVVFVSGDSPDSYKNQHIKGSVVMGAHHLHHSDIMGNMHCAPLYQCIEEAEHHIGEQGIDNDTMVIAYDDFRGPNSTGVYSFFKSYGHDNIKILMGGFKSIQELDPAKKELDVLKKKIKKASAPQKIAKNIKRYTKNVAKGGDAETVAKNQKKLDKAKAKAAKLGDFDAILAKSKKDVKKLKKQMKKVTARLLVNKDDSHLKMVGPDDHRKLVSLAPKHYKIDEHKVDLSGIAGKEEVLHAVKDIAKNGKKSKYMIIDARGMTEIIGERKMDNVGRGGHIPGATFLEWKQISDNKRSVSMKKAKELTKIFKKYGVTKDKTIYAYCHVGAGRGSEIITALELLGYKNAKVYTGSWDEWGNDLALPIKK